MKVRWVKRRLQQFLAAAPLRYLRRYPPVDFGALMIWGEEARETFDEGEQDMLLELANMLVYQLATLVNATSSTLILAIRDTGGEKQPYARENTGILETIHDSTKAS